MRCLAVLYCFFKEVLEDSDEEMKASLKIGGTVEDMFDRTNFNVLEQAIERNTEGKEGIKPGLTRALKYLLQNAATSLRGHYLIAREDQKAEEIDRFLAVFKLKSKILFSSAEYLVQKGRQMKLRRPEELPSEQDIATVRDYTIRRMKEIINPFTMWGPHEFKELRDLLICCLTLFNARRGGEPSCRQISDWNDADKGVWLLPDQVANQTDTLSKALLQRTKIAYLSGKGTSRIVSVLIPDDCVNAMRIITDPDIRKSCRISPDFKYLSPLTQESEDHTSGWHCVHDVVRAAGIEDPLKISATKMRHRTRKKQQPKDHVLLNFYCFDLYFLLETAFVINILIQEFHTS